MITTRTILILLPLSSLLHAGESDTDLAALPAGKDAKDSLILRPPATSQRWSLGAGVMFRKIGEISFDTGISPDRIPNLFGVDTFTEPPGIGPLGTPANRTYDDGFVNIGAATPGTGLTTFWGYNGAGQIQGDNLVFSRTGGERRDVTLQSTASTTGWSDHSNWEAGPVLELTYSVGIRPNVSAGFAFNFSSVNIGGSQAGLSTISQFQQLDVFNVTAIDTFSLNGVIPPGAPYTGSFNGPGALIGNTPDSRVFPETLASATTALFVDSVREELDLDLHSFGLGGHVNWMPNPQVFLTAQLGVTINLADWKAQRDEVITQSNNGGPAAVFSRRTVRNDDTDIVAGVYLQGNAAWRISDHWSIHGFLRYDWNQDVDGQLGPSTFNVDLTGWSVGAGARVSF